MAEEIIGQRQETKAAWTKIFSAFKVALDPKKLLLAAAGVLAMSFGWWVLGWVFYAPQSTPPEWVAYKPSEGDEREAWVHFKGVRQRWNLLNEMAGDREVRYDEADVAESLAEYRLLTEWKQNKIETPLPSDLKDRYKKYGAVKPWGRLRKLPWNEDRGPNPYLLVSENIGPVSAERGKLLGWLVSDQLPNLIEPLVKFLAPIKYMFYKGAGGWNRIYLVLVILWTLLVWGYFGGAITRMAAVQLARNEKITMREALSFAKLRCQSYFAAPLFPLVFLGILTFILIIFGLFSGLIPIVGDILIAGLLWPIVLILGVVMAVVLVGLVGWPLMYPTISTEGSDSFDALSRSYSYVYQAPWQYIGYSLVALLYGAVLVFFVGFMGSLIVYAGEWGVSQAPFLSSNDPKRDREPTFLFVEAPTSYGWRDLLLHGSKHAVVGERTTAGGIKVLTYTMDPEYMNSMQWYNWVGTFLVSIWIYLFFMLVVGFGYSYFWTASTVIYLLMRRYVDDTDIDEVHVDEEDLDESFGKDTMPPAPAPAATGGVTMVEPPVLRTSAQAGTTSSTPLPMATQETNSPPASFAPPPSIEPHPSESPPPSDGSSPPTSNP